MTTGSPTRTGRERERPGGAGANQLGARTAFTGQKGRTRPGRLRGTGGTQLLEFALAMPFLVVIAIGVTDFGQAYNTKHILTNAAREAARITVSNPLSDQSCPVTDPPCSIQAAAEAVKVYLTNASLSQASCITPAQQSSGSLATLTWTYTCNSVTLTIDRSLALSGGPNGTVIPAAQVTLSYPYTWTLSRVIGLLGGGTVSLPTTLTNNVVMQILVTG